MRKAPTRRAPAKPSTALARRKKAPIVRRPASSRTPPNVDILPPAMSAQMMSLPTDPIMVVSFVGTFKLTAGQIGALRRPVKYEELDWKPMVRDGPPVLPYLSHNGTRDRFDAAFGLGGWGVVPVAMPKIVDDLVLIPYALVVGGVPRAYAWGEQQYHPNNKQMTYGDALEGAKSNAIMRCGKELGVGRELWNKTYLAEIMAKHAGVATRRSRPASAKQQEDRSVPHQHHDAHGAEKISDPQRKRLWVILRKSGRDEQTFRSWLALALNVTSTSDIMRRDYEYVCNAVESSGKLPPPPEREPGEEG